MTSKREVVWMLVAAAGLSGVGRVALAQATPATPATPASTPAAADAKPEGLPDAKSVLERAIAAAGGRDRLAAIKNRVSTGRMEVPAQGMKAAMTLTQAAPDLLMVEVDLPGLGKVQQAHDGQVGWEVNPMQGARLIEGNELAALLRGATLNADIAYETQYKAWETVGAEEVAGKKAVQVKMTPNTGEPTLMSFDADSGLLLKMTGSVQSGMGELQTVTLLEDYRDVDGLRLSFRSRVQVVGMGVEQVVIFEKIEHNLDLPADRFAMPEPVKKLVGEKATAKPATAGSTGGHGG